MKNPFKFGSIVDTPYFIDRQEEIERVKSYLASENHLIIISPRRFGKSSLIDKVMREIDRPFILLDMQLITTAEDFAAQMLKRVHRLYPFEKIKQVIRNFKIIPNISLNPLNNEVDISFQSGSPGSILVEDVLNLIEKLSKQAKKTIIVFDEFQDIKNIDKLLDRQLRSIIQYHKKINYVFLGSQESLMRDIFEKKKSPFYHFGTLMPLAKIPHQDFINYLSQGFKIVSGTAQQIAKEILVITRAHPYYTQQLAFYVWELVNRHKNLKQPVETACDEIIQHHDIDYERLWNTLNRTDMKILIGMSVSETSPLSSDFSKNHFDGATSTIFSSLKRLTLNSLVIKTESGYEIDDPLFKRWLIKRRQT